MYVLANWWRLKSWVNHWNCEVYVKVNWQRVTALCHLLETSGICYSKLGMRKSRGQLLEVSGICTTELMSCKILALS